MKNRISFMEKVRRLLMSPFDRMYARNQTREFRRWQNGWKRHCSSRSMIRRIGSRKRAIELGIIKG